MTLTKEQQRRLALLDALEAGGVDNWEGYDFATEEYRKTIGREEVAEDIIQEICELFCEYVEEPAGRGCGFGFAPTAIDMAVSILLKRIGEFK